VALVIAGGCGPPAREAERRERLVGEVLGEDPEFAWVLERHRTIANRMETYERELALKRTTVEQGIAQLRKEFEAATEQVRKKIDETKQRLKPDRATLQMALSQAQTELRAKQLQRAHLGRSLATLRKQREGGPRSNESERGGPDAQMQELLADGRRLDQEMAALRAHLRLLKLKLELIRL
jgi:hypothetical protein